MPKRSPHGAPPEHQAALSILEMLTEAREVARHREFKMLDYLVSMAIEECRDVAAAHAPSPVSRDGSTRNR